MNSNPQCGRKDINTEKSGNHDHAETLTKITFLENKVIFFGIVLIRKAFDIARGEVHDLRCQLELCEISYETSRKVSSRPRGFKGKGEKEDTSQSLGN